MSDRQLKAHCLLDEDSRQLIEMAVDKLGLSVRAYTRILKVARTIADLEDANNIEASHIAEAIQYRSLDRRTI
jgi:magnesium chelatase family protein